MSPRKSARHRVGPISTMALSTEDKWLAEDTASGPSSMVVSVTGVSMASTDRASSLDDSTTYWDIVMEKDEST